MFFDSMESFFYITYFVQQDLRFQLSKLSKNIET